MLDKIKNMNNRTKIYYFVLAALIIAIICILLFLEGDDKNYAYIPGILFGILCYGYYDGYIDLGPSKKDLEEMAAKQRTDEISSAMRGVGKEPKPLIK